MFATGCDRRSNNSNFDKTETNLDYRLEKSLFFYISKRVFRVQLQALIELKSAPKIYVIGLAHTRTRRNKKKNK